MKIEQMTSVLIKKSGRFFEILANDRLKKLGITHAQSLVIARLHHEPKLNQNELCKSAGVRQPTMVRTLDRMERDGLVSRKNSTHDRREFLFELTSKGKAIAKQLHEVIINIDKIAIADLSTQEKHQLNELLNKVLKTLGSNL